MIIAAIYIAARHLKTKNKEEISLAQDLSSFSVFALLALLSLDEMAHDKPKRKDTRFGLFALLILLFIVESWGGSILLPKGYTDEWEIF